MSQEWYVALTQVYAGSYVGKELKVMAGVPSLYRLSADTPCICLLLQPRTDTAGTGCVQARVDLIPKLVWLMWRCVCPCVLLVWLIWRCVCPCVGVADVTVCMSMCSVGVTDVAVCMSMCSVGVADVVVCMSTCWCG